MNPDDIYRLLSQTIDLPITLDGPFISPVTTEEGERFLRKSRAISDHLLPFIEKINDYYMNVFSWVKANPSDNRIVEAIKSVYVFSDHAGTDAYNYVNTVIGDNNFIETIIDNKYQTVFLLGQRGAGKSFYLNYVMNTRIDSLYDDYKMFWYRVDGSKLYDKNKKASTSPSSYNEAYLSLEDYLFLHIIYVSFTYQHKSTLWQNIFKTHHNEFIDILFNTCLSYYTTKNIRSEDIRESLRQITDSLRFKHTKDNIFKYLYEYGGIINYRLLAESIITYLLNNNYKLIIVFDGIDNIDYHEFKDLYKGFLTELTGYCLDDKPNPFKAKVVISLRDETYQHLRKLRNNYFKRNYKLFRIKEHDIDKIISAKSAVAINPLCEYWLSMRDKDNFQIELMKKTNDNIMQLFNSLQEYDKSFKSFSDGYVQKVLSATNSLLRGGLELYQINDGKELVRKLFNNNLRQFIHNFINVFRYATLFKTKTNISAEREYVINEGLLLNGNIYLNSSDRYEFGQFIPNIFYFDFSEEKQKWHGLCLYRILQTMIEKQLTKDKIINELNKLFDYNKGIIEERFDIGIIYGLIKCIYNNNEIYYELTEKGTFFIKYIFLDINQFYYISLDTPFSKPVVNNSKLIRYHNNGSIYWQNYNVASVLSSISLIRTIISQHKIEKDTIISNGLKFNYNYNLPVEFPKYLINGMVGKIIYLKKFKLRDFEELIRDIKGII